MMNRTTLAGALLTLLAGVSLATAGQLKLGNQTFTLPDGFEIELVAGPPLVDRPISANFDELGQLYVTDSSGSNDKVEKQLAERTHRVVRLADTDGDGRYDQSVVFADKMMFPEGALWYDGSLYVAAPPSIWKLTDTNGDGVADQRVEWFQGKTLTGCANDLHGPYLGPDGWIYWCKGAFAQQTYERPGKKPLVTRAAHIFRCRPDGSQLEPVMTGGMDNPVEVVFTPGGERIFTTTFLQHPGGGKRDGLIHAVYGGVYGKVHEVIDDHPRTGEVLEPLVHLGAAAPCGLARYESRGFGEQYQDNLFAALFNMHKVTRHVLSPEGSTFKSRDEDFLVSDQFDFHPTDVLEDADGSLLVIDTGGWYKLCCPTSQLAKPDVLGAIYRVRRKGAKGPADPRGLKLDWNKLDTEGLANLLGDERPAVSRRAVHELAKLGDRAIPAAKRVASTGSARARLAAVWCLCRIDGTEARAPVRAKLADSDPTVRVAALHATSLWRDRDALSPLISLLASDDAHVRRGAVEALGRSGDRSAAALLLAAAERPTDRVLEHSIAFALIEIADPDAVRTHLASTSPGIKRAALVALDQMEGGGLDPQVVAPLLTSPDKALSQTARWIVSRHRDWGRPLAASLRDRLADTRLSDEEHADLQQLLAGLARDGAVQDLLTAALADPSLAPRARVTVLRAMARSGVKEIPVTWAAKWTDLLAHGDQQLVPEVVAAAHALAQARPAPADLAQQLARVAGDQKYPDTLRLEALAAAAGGLPSLEAGLFGFARKSLAASEPARVRGLATESLVRAHLSADQLAALCDELRRVGPIELPRLLAAFEQSKDPEIGRKLLAALGEAGPTAGLRSEQVRPILARFGNPLEQPAAALYAALDVKLQQQKAELTELAKKLSGGDVRRGQAVFNSQKAACFACHAIGYLGGRIGPDLTHIGQIRSEVDLVESIVFPSASFVRSYEPTVVVTTSGKLHSGVVQRDAPDEIVLAVSAQEEVRVPRDEIDEMRPGTVSIMPAGLNQQLSLAELADLVAFLKAAR